MRAPAGWMALAVAAGVIAAPALASAANPTIKDDLAPKVAQACVKFSGSPQGPDGAVGTMSAAGLRTAIQASKVANLVYQFGEDMSASTTASRAMRVSHETDGPNKLSYMVLKHLAIAWTDPAAPSEDILVDDFLPLAKGGVRAVRRSGEVSASESEAVLEDILAGRDARFIFYCGKSEPSPEPPPPRKTPAFTLALAKSPGDLSSKLDKKPFAQGAFVHNEVSNEETYSLYATLGVLGKTSEPKEGPVRVFNTPGAFVQFEREASNVSGDKVNNLNFGLQSAGRVVLRGETTSIHYYDVAVRYLTDDSFESAAWSVTARWRPWLPAPAYGVEAGDDFRVFWDMAVVADAIQVNEAGDKAEWLTKPQFARLGFDIEGRLRWLWTGDPGDGSFVLSGSYKVRDGQTDDGGDARRLELGLGYEPTPMMRIGLDYERGENIDSLEFGEQWKASLGLRF